MEIKEPVKGTSLVFKKNAEGKLDDSLSFSDGETYDIKAITERRKELLPKVRAVCKETSGNENFGVTETVLNLIQEGMVGEDWIERKNQVATVLPLLQPRDTTEALLAGQFVNLQKAGNRCLSNANHADNGSRIEFFITQASKLFRLANETMQTLI